MALKPLVFEILLALSGEPRHGWSLVGEVESRLGEPLLPGNFYRTLRRIQADGLIEEAPQAGDGDGDERRRYFRLTPKGVRVAQAEARRLTALAADARTRRLLRAR